jgi:hypothetical protein
MGALAASTSSGNWLVEDDILLKNAIEVIPLPRIAAGTAQKVLVSVPRLGPLRLRCPISLLGFFLGRWSTTDGGTGFGLWEFYPLARMFNSPALEIPCARDHH